MNVEERLRDLGIGLPEPPPPAGNYIGAVTVGNLVFLSGHGPRSPSGEYSGGKVGSELTQEQGQEEARQVGLNVLATLRAEIGDLDRVRPYIAVLHLKTSPKGYTSNVSASSNNVNSGIWVMPILLSASRISSGGLRIVSTKFLAPSAVSHSINTWTSLGLSPPRNILPPLEPWAPRSAAPLVVKNPFHSA